MLGLSGYQTMYRGALLKLTLRQEGSGYEKCINLNLFLFRNPFLSRVSILTRVIYILYVRLSVRPLRFGIPWKRLNILL